MNSIRTNRLLAATIAVCVCAVAAASLINPRTGACGTMHYMFFQLLSGLIVSAKEEVWASPYDRAILNALAVILNVVVFGVIVRYWLGKADKRWRISGVAALAIVYIASYLFLLPTTACP